MEHEIYLSEEGAISYVKKNTSIFGDQEILHATVLAGDSMEVDGNANRILRVHSESSEQSVIVKQVLPFIRVAMERGEVLPISMERMRTEIQYMNAANRICESITPEIYAWDQKSGTVVMEDLKKMKILRFELMEGNKFPAFPEKFGSFLGRIAFLTSDLHLDPWEKRTMENYFGASKSNHMWGRFMFDDTVLSNQDNPINPLVREWVDQLYRDESVRREVRVLKSIFNQQQQCLIHTDLHTSNIFISLDEVKVFDSEFAKFGPIGFDLGRLIGSLALNFASLFGLKEWDQAKRKDYQVYLLESIQFLYEAFEASYFGLWNEIFPQRKAAKERMKAMIFQQTLGFTACTMLARIYDGALCFDFKRIESLEERAKGQRFAIEMAKRLLIRRYEYKDMAQVMDDMREVSLHRNQAW
ncbi:S-methyl-5-thioribose kinase [Gottschalkiaceae bacterium SANA]|nr:S-methyl-5-thioribose kinase [Gottschalkiaceae bacterium SANA]